MYAAISSSSFKRTIINGTLPGSGFGGKTLADFDNDGELEFTAASRAGGIYVFDRQANGSWTTHTVSQTTNFQIGGAAHDINRDGRVDFTVGSYWYRNDGNFRFTQFRFDSSHNAAHDAVFADVNGDNKADLVLISDEHPSSWYNIPANPEGGNWPKQGIGNNTQSEDIHGALYPRGVGDIDNDGDNDLVMPTYWLQNSGTGSFTKKEYGVSDVGRRGGYGWSTRAWIADIDKDGMNDIAMTDSDMVRSRAWILFGKGGGTFERVNMPVDSSGRGSFHSLVLADFDCDQDLDFFTSDQEDWYQIYPPDGRPKQYMFENQGSRNFTQRLIFDDTWGGQEPGVGDVDKDGDLDMVMATWTHKTGGRAHVDFIENTMQCSGSTSGSGTNTTGNGSTNTTGNTSGGTTGSQTRSLDDWEYKLIDNARQKWHGGFSLGLAFADVNGDGKKDITSGKYLYLNPGNLSANWQRVTLPDMDASLITDVDNDSFIDIIAQDFSSGAIKLNWLEATNEAATSFAVRSMFGTIPGPGSHAHPSSQGYHAVQIEQGGKPELVFNSFAQGIFYFRIPSNPESGNWPRVQLYNVSTESQPTAAGDVDGDGNIDIVGRDTQAGTSMVWYKNPGTGAGSWQRFTFGTAGSSARDYHGDMVRVADINRDGKNDIVVAEELWNTNAPNANILVFTQTGNPQATSGWSKQSIHRGYSFNNLDVADMDGDGDSDILTWEHQFNPKRAFVLENKNNGASWTPHIVGQGRDSHVAGQAVDLDNDGDFDIVGNGFYPDTQVHVYINTSRAPSGTTNITGTTNSTGTQTTSTTGNTTGSQSTACHLIQPGGSLAQGFGAPWNVFTNQLLLRVTCSSQGAELAIEGTQYNYIYTQAHVWNGSGWQQFTLSGAQIVGGVWVVGSARANIPNTSLSQNFVVSYVCTWIPSGSSGSWKCGCRDQTCQTPMWQVQAFSR